MDTLAGDLGIKFKPSKDLGISPKYVSPPQEQGIGISPLDWTYARWLARNEQIIPQQGAEE